MREALLALLLILATAAVVRGVAMFSEPVAWIVGGLLGAGLAVLFLAEAATT